MMAIQEISVRELPGFIDSALYSGSHVIPITPERVFSQVNNPRAKPDDIVLIVAYTEEGRLAGFIGMLPDTGNSSDGPYRFIWNSCWWVDPKLGKGIALKLFYRSIQVWQGNYMITDFTQHTRKIVELTRLFYLVNPVQGIRIQILSDFSGKLVRKAKAFRLFLPFSLVVDKAINLILAYRLKKWSRKNAPEGLSIEYMESMDNDCLNYIDRHNGDELCRRGGQEFDWMISYPWLVRTTSVKPAVKYPFSHECSHFEFIIARITDRGKIAGIVLFSNREDFFKIPYAYYEPLQINLFSYAVCKILIDRKAAGFCTFRNEIRDYIKKNNFPFFYKKNVIKELAVSKTISDRLPEKFYLQDGDGDVVFT
jgi:hypothetical protein